MSRQLTGSPANPSGSRLACHTAATSKPAKVQGSGACNMPAPNYSGTSGDLHSPAAPMTLGPHLIPPQTQQLPALLSPRRFSSAALKARQVPALNLNHLQRPAAMLESHKQEWGMAQHAQQDWQSAPHPQKATCPHSPHTARSSQSDATHLDHPDSYRSLSALQGVLQPAGSQHDDEGNLPAMHQQPAADTALLTGQNSHQQGILTRHEDSMSPERQEMAPTDDRCS